MAEDQSFADLIQRVRSGNADAAAEIVRLFEPEIRRRVRTWIRLNGPELRPLFESMDVCQSILSDFFLRASAGMYDIDDPQHVLALLSTMARNKVRNLARDQRRGRRDARRKEPLGSWDPADSADPTASRIVAGREMLQLLRSRFTDEERRLADLRGDGADWAAIAAELGGTPDARRKQYARAVNRIARELGLDEHGEDLL